MVGEKQGKVGEDQRNLGENLSFVGEGLEACRIITTEFVDRFPN